MPRSGDVPRGTARDAKHELIGLNLEVTTTNHPPLEGLTGRVVDETRGTLVVETREGERVVPKIGQVFTFTRPDGTRFTMAGERIAYRPEDRLKKST